MKGAYMADEDKSKEYDLFGEEIKSEAQKQWKDMPEFVQEKENIYAKIVIRFDTKAELDLFGTMIGQKLDSRTKSFRFRTVEAIHAAKYKTDHSGARIRWQCEEETPPEEPHEK